MKTFLLISTGLIALTCRALAQCPTPGLKIQSAACEDPRNLQLGAVTCTELKVKWLGNKGQTYVVKATGIDPATSNAFEGRSSGSSCDNLGNCQATLSVKEGAVVSWSVQAVCSAEGAVVYSSEVNGGTATIPVCRKEPDSSSSNILHVYPNPASDYLNVQYDGTITGVTEFRIYDITGKMQYVRQDGAAIKTHSLFRLDIRKLPPGTYLLEAANGKDVHQTKFVLLRN